MFLNFFRGKRATMVAEPAALPPGIRAYAIGDIHGRLDLLDRLMEAIDADDAARPPAETHLIFLGDLIDRGAQSAAVIDRTLQIMNSRANVTVIGGNHEEVFLRALEGDRKALRFCLRIGGRETVLSYGISVADYDASDFNELADLLARNVPDTHRAFLRSLPHSVTLGDYLFVHAGIRPGVALEEQRPSDMKWIRDEFLDHQGYEGRVVVHGHTPTAEVEHRHNRIGIDTGAWESGRLTALGLEGTDRWFIDTMAGSERAPATVPAASE